MPRELPADDLDHVSKPTALAAGLALAIAASMAGTAAAQSGGASPDSSRAPSAEPEPSPALPDPDRDVPAQRQGPSGGTKAPARKRRRPRRSRVAPVVTEVRASPSRFFAGEATRIRYRVADDSPKVEIRLYIKRVRYPSQRRVIKLGGRRTGVVHTYRWRNEHALKGLLEVKVWAQDPSGRKAARSSESPGTARFRYQSHVFPVNGPYDLGGDGHRFGAPRRGHIHQGHDISAAEGTPLLAVRSGRISWRRYQAGGAGYYLVLDADDGNDYVYMHLQQGSILVREGDRVRTGQRIASVGSTGVSSGPHLHFEIWVGAWFDGGSAIDPLPMLRDWIRQGGAVERKGLAPAPAPQPEPDPAPAPSPDTGGAGTPQPR